MSAPFSRHVSGVGTHAPDQIAALSGAPSTAPEVAANGGPHRRSPHAAYIPLTQEHARCAFHYYRVSRRISGLPGSGIEHAEGCHVWTGLTNGRGYGKLYVGGRPGAFVLAHRFMWTLANGEIPEGLTIDHVCQRIACVNPAHMQLVSLAENSRLASARKRPLAAYKGRLADAVLHDPEAAR